jgi:2-aminobenzoate-CoA ligase
MKREKKTVIRSAHVDTFARDRLPPKDAWPEFLFESKNVQYPALLNCASELLDVHIRAGRGDARAVGMLVDGKPVFASYLQLNAQTNRIANVLTQKLGLVPGNRVLVRAPNHPMFAAIWLAAMKAGLIVVPTMPLLRAFELQQVLKKSAATVALCDAGLCDELNTCMKPDAVTFAPALQRIVLFRSGEPGSLEQLMDGVSDQFKSVATRADDISMLAFTSGTTGEPKATVHFHRDVLAMCDSFSRTVLKPDASDLFIGTPPIAFTFGLGGQLCFPLRVGAAVILIERLTPDLLLQAIETSGATISFTAPTFYRQMALLLKARGSSADKPLLKTLKKSVSAGEALPDAIRTMWRECTGIEMIDGIGSTEMMHIFISSAGADVRRGAIGRVVPGYQAMVVDDQMRPAPFNTIGKLAVKGPTGCRYLDDERQSKYVREGWNLPGDAFTMDADGYFFYQARTDDMIISAGYNIAGPEVEAVLLSHEAVADCGVVGIADSERGQIVKAFVILKPHAEPGDGLIKALQDFVKASIAPYKYPRAIEFCRELPRTETGKLQRFRLRADRAS